MFDRWSNTRRVMPDGQRQIYSMLATVYKGQRFVDVGCAVGVGSNILAHDSHVLALDVEPEEIDFARAMFANPRLMFDVHDILTPHGFGTFDVVVMVEVIEHIARSDWDTALGNLERFFHGQTHGYISTPNRNAPGMGESGPRNEFHTYEAPAAEFVALLERHFRDVVLLSPETFRRIEVTTEETPVLARVCGPRYD